MTPDFHELVGDEDSAEALARLRRVHELLVEAGPPAPGELPAAPAPPHARILHFPRPRPQTVVRLAAAASIAVAFGIGFVVGNQGEGFKARWSVTMRGVGTASAASARVEVGAPDRNGNWPMLVEARGLPELPKHGLYELYLWHEGKRGASCGTFAAGKGLASVRLNAPYYADGYGWVLVVHAPGRADRTLLTT